MYYLVIKQLDRGKFVPKRIILHLQGRKKSIQNFKFNSKPKGNHHRSTKDEQETDDFQLPADGYLLLAPGRSGMAARSSSCMKLQTGRLLSVCMFFMML